jgi:tetratricopeptide (TPR) repeat protein
MRNFCILLATFFLISCGTKKQSDKPHNLELVSEDIDVLTTLMMANEYYERDDYEKAAKGFELVIRLDSTIGEAYYKLGYSLASIKKTLYEEAEEKNEEMTLDFINQKDTSALTIINNYIKAAEHNYRPVDAYYNAGIYTSIFIFDDLTAIELFRKSLEINPDQPEVVTMIEDAKKRLTEESDNQ